MIFCEFVKFLKAPFWRTPKNGFVYPENAEVANWRYSIIKVKF